MHGDEDDDGWLTGVLGGELGFCSVEPDEFLLAADNLLDPLAEPVPFGTGRFISSIMSAPLEIRGG